MTTGADWQTVGLDWPNRAASRFVEAGGIRWHLQQMGRGDTLLLVHGTGASTHSWRDVAPLLARHYHVVAPDLPGHGFTGTSVRDGADAQSLPGMAAALAALLQATGVVPRWVVGHSAGAAILARMCIDGVIAPQLFISLNGALLPLGGFRSPLFSPLARLFVSNPIVPRLFAWQASQPATFARMMDQTGSRLDARGIELYQRLASRPAHVAAALDMMARWDVRTLERDLPGLATPLVLVSGGRDGMIPPSHALGVQALVPHARVMTLAELGHLAHEERPGELAELIHRLCTEHVGRVPA